MALHAKSNGWLIGGKIISEDSYSWIFKAADEKHSKVIAKGDPNNYVFDGDNALGDAEAWLKMRKKARSLSKTLNFHDRLLKI